MLRRLIEIGEGKQSTMEFKRISIDQSTDLNEYGQMPLQVAVPIKRNGPSSLNLGNRKKEHTRIMKENALIARRLSQ